MEPRVFATYSMRQPQAIFDLEDRLVRERQGGATHPRPFGTLTITIVAEVLAAGTRQWLNPPLELLLKRSGSGYLLWFGLVKRGGAQRRISLTGRYMVRIEGAAYLPAMRDDVLIPERTGAYFFDLEANEFHPLNR